VSELVPSAPPAASGLTLRLCQQQAVDATITKWREFKRLLGVSPTGSGKTLIFAFIAWMRLQFGPVLILVHRDELIGQTIRKLYTACGLSAAKEKADLRAGLEDQVVVASVQTLCRRDRLLRYPFNHFRTAIVDEAHRTLGPSYLEILGHFPQANVLGVTATPDRGDKQSLSNFYDGLAFEFLLTDMIREGWLCPIKVKTVPLEIDISQVGMRAGDYSEEELSRALEPVLQELAEAVKEHVN
jgi:superfamily II DNA or RNA helicase